MSTKAQRGTKRTCQNPECGSRFYDLNRNPIVCPICESVYELAMSAASSSAAAAAAEDKAARKVAKKPAFVPAESPKDPDAAEADAEDLVIEGEEEAGAAADDETFLEEEEEDGADVSGIIGPVDDTDEPS